MGSTTSTTGREIKVAKPQEVSITVITFLSFITVFATQKKEKREMKWTATPTGSRVGWQSSSWVAQQIYDNNDNIYIIYTCIYIYYILYILYIYYVLQDLIISSQTNDPFAGQPADFYQGGRPCGSAFRARSVFELSMRPCDQDVKLCQNHRPQKNDEPFFIIFWWLVLQLNILNTNVNLMAQIKWWTLTIVFVSLI